MSKAYSQAQLDLVVAMVGRQAQRAESIVSALEQIVKDRSITRAGRVLARKALDDARVIGGDALSALGGEIPELLAPTSQQRPTPRHSKDSPRGAGP